MDKAAQIERVVEDLIRRQQSGTSISHSDVAGQHPELMPDLGDRLATLRAIEAAAEHAREQPDSTGPFPELDASFREDLEILRDALPAYEIAERLRHGGQGVVYKAIQLSTNRPVAIKVLLGGSLVTDRQRHRFAREVALIARLRHPNIVTVYDSGVIRGRQYFAMEYVEGLTIDDYLLLHGLGVRERVRLFTKICYAVSFAHQRGIIHRDLKPSNVLVDPDGEPHILDFGLAKDYSTPPDEADSASISMSGQVVGTLPYLSPEQARGAGDEVEVRSDIYSLGVMLFEMLTGGFPYPVDGEPLAVRNDIVNREPLPPGKVLSGDTLGGCVTRADITDDLEAIVLKALEKEKCRRYQSAAAFAEDLLRYLAGDAVQAKAASTFYVLKKTMRKFRVHVTIAGVFLVILLAGATGAGVLLERHSRIYQTGLHMGALVKLGSVERDEGRLEEAVALFEKALELGDKVASTDPEVLRSYYGAHHRLAELYLEQMRDYEGAEPHCRAATRIATEAVKADPADLRWRRQSGFARTLQGRLAFGQHRWEEALGAFDQAATVFEDLIAHDPDNPVAKHDFAFAREMQARCCQKLDRHDEAFTHYAVGYQIHKKLYESNPDSIGYALDLANSEVNLAAWSLWQKTFEEDQKAAMLLERTEARLTELGESALASTRSWDIQRILDDIRRNKRVLRNRAERRATE